MAKRKQIPKTKKKNLLKGKSKSEEVENLVKSTQNLNDDFLVSFKYLDRQQGQTLEEWESEGILAKAMETLRNFCSDKLTKQIDSKKFTIYGNFPPKNSSNACT